MFGIATKDAMEWELVNDFTGEDMAELAEEVESDILLEEAERDRLNRIDQVNQAHADFQTLRLMTASITGMVSSVTSLAGFLTQTKNV